jgi:hypothetical protein
MTWQVIETEGLPHVVPYQDLKPHGVVGECWCHPYEDDGVIVHNSMDKRERYERGEMMQKPVDSMTPQPPPPKLTRVRWIEEEDLIIKGPEA